MSIDLIHIKPRRAPGRPRPPGPGLGIVLSVTRPVTDEPADPYLDGTHRWWHLSRPSPELAAAQADGFLGAPGLAVDLGCGLATELRHLAASGWTTLGIDLSLPALQHAAVPDHATGHDRAAAGDPAASSARPVGLAQADVLRLPLGDARADLLLDRGCFHYVSPEARAAYAAEARRVLRPGGRFLLRACRTAAGVANDLTPHAIERVFRGWHISNITSEDIVSDTRTMPSLTARLIRP
jgi:SAM-dependent methyltransferase